MQRLSARHLQHLVALAIGTTRDGAEVAEGSLGVARLKAIKDDIAVNLASMDLSISALALRHQVTPRYIQKNCRLDGPSEQLLENAMTRMGLSARAHDRILKVARTIADIEGAPEIATKHIAESIQYRSLDRSYWA